MHTRVKMHEAHGHGVGEAGGWGYSGLLKYAACDIGHVKQFEVH